MIGLEQKINYQLNKYPKVKRMVKSAYQHIMYAVSPKIKSEGSITRISPDDQNHEYFFGYYDKSPWDITDRYMLCLRAKDTWSDVSPKETADILLIDTCLPENDRNRVKKIAETRSWNVQQSCMLQWLGPDFSSCILYNDYRDGRYAAVILELKSGKESVVPYPVYTVSGDGKTALTLDFSRLYNLRPGYGYYNVREKTEGVALPEEIAVWKINLESREIIGLLTYKDFAEFQPRPEMQEKGSVHKINHIMISPNGQRFMVLYRWFVGARKYTRLITCNIDGTDMYVLSDDNMVSHCFWKDDEQILAFGNKKNGGTGYYLMKDKTPEYKRCWSELTGDGHPSYSPNKKYIVTDSYPDRTRIQYLRVMEDEDGKPRIVAKLFSPFKYDNDTRCDLHPRWNHAGNKVCFDSVFEGHRGMYVVDISQNVDFTESRKWPKFSIITPMYNSFSLMDRYFGSIAKQTYRNFEVIIIDDCSTDGSFEQALEQAKKMSTSIHILKNEKNGGPGNARNKGMEAATGEYILFVDSDDYMAENMLELLEGKTENSDMIFFDYYRTNDIGSKYRKTISSSRMILSRENILLNCTTSVCGKAIRKRIVNEYNIRFPHLLRYEDWVFMAQVIAKSSNFTYIQKGLYYYFDNIDSIVHTSPQKAHTYSIQAFDIMESILNRISFDLSEALYVREVIYVTAKEIIGTSKKEDFWKTIGTLQQRYPNWSDNKLIKKFSMQQRIVISLLHKRLYIVLKGIIKCA